MKHITATRSQHLRRSVSVLFRLMMAAAVAFIFLGSASAQTAIKPSGKGTEGDPYQITVVGNLAWMSDTVASSSGKYYKMMNDIDASETAKWDNGKGFVPIGRDTARFEGVFDVNNKKITGLTINRPDTDSIGLFGRTYIGSMIKNLGLEDFTIAGNNFCGGLAGGVSALSSSTLCITNCYTSGSVSGNGYCGGLVGYQRHGSISNCYSTGNVSDGGYCGGLIGCQDGGSISESYSTGNVSGSDCGGLVGCQEDGFISNCYSTGRVSSNKEWSIGFPCRGTNKDCYYDMETSGQNEIGMDTISMDIISMDIGGIDISMDTGKGKPKTTAEMKQRATFAGWDFATIWGIKEKESYPYLLTLPPRQP